jgi:hypothetical protein
MHAMLDVHMQDAMLDPNLPLLTPTTPLLFTWQHCHPVFETCGICSLLHSAWQLLHDPACCMLSCTPDHCTQLHLPFAQHACTVKHCCVGWLA